MTPDWDRLRDNYGNLTDKFDNDYGPLYQKLYELLPSDPKVLELGVREGGSLMLWRDLWPDGLIVGVDKDPESYWPEGTVKIVAAQDDRDIQYLCERACPDGYDLIIDDCSHLGRKARVSLEELWPLVKKGGWYVLEDWSVGIPGNPYWGQFDDGMSIFDLARDMMGMCGNFLYNDGDAEEFFGRNAIIALRKRRKPRS